jgi:hypothetical protein
MSEAVRIQHTAYNRHTSGSDMLDESRLAAAKLYCHDDNHYSSTQFPPSYDGAQFDVDANRFIINTNSFTEQQVLECEQQAYHLEVTKRDPVITLSRFVDAEGLPLSVLPRGLKTTIAREPMEYIAAYYGSINTNSAVDLSPTCSSRLVDLSSTDIGGFVLDGAAHCVATYANDPDPESSKQQTAQKTKANARLVHHSSPLFDVDRVRKLGFIPPGFVMLQAVHQMDADAYVYISYSEKYWFSRRLYATVFPEHDVQSTVSQSPLRELTAKHATVEEGADQAEICSAPPVMIEAIRAELHKHDKVADRIPGVSIFDLNLPKDTEVPNQILAAIIRMSQLAALHAVIPQELTDIVTAADGKYAIACAMNEHYPPIPDSHRRRTGVSIDVDLTDSDLTGLNPDEVQELLAYESEKEFCRIVAAAGTVINFNSLPVDNALEQKVLAAATSPGFRDLRTAVLFEAEQLAATYIDMFTGIDVSTVPATHVVDSVPMYAIAELLPLTSLEKLIRYQKDSGKVCRGKKTRSIPQAVVNAIKNYLLLVNQCGTWNVFSQLRAQQVEDKKNEDKMDEDKINEDATESDKKALLESWMEEVDDDDGTKVVVNNWQEHMFNLSVVKEHEEYGQPRVHPLAVSKEAILAALYADDLYNASSPITASDLNALFMIAQKLALRHDAMVTPESIAREQDVAMRLRNQKHIFCVAQLLHDSMTLRMNAYDDDPDLQDSDIGYWPYYESHAEPYVDAVSNQFDTNEDVDKFMAAYIKKQGAYIDEMETKNAEASRRAVAKKRTREEKKKANSKQRILLVCMHGYAFFACILTLVRVVCMCRKFERRDRRSGPRRAQVCRRR